MENQSIEILTRIVNAILHGVDWIAVALVILGGLIAKYRLADWTHIYKWKVGLPIKTLIIGTASITIYVSILQWAGLFIKADAPKFFFGYITATALYPILVKPIENLIKKGINGE